MSDVEETGILLASIPRGASNEEESAGPPLEWTSTLPFSSCSDMNVSTVLERPPVAEERCDSNRPHIHDHSCGCPSLDSPSLPRRDLGDGILKDLLPSGEDLQDRNGENLVAL